MKRADYGPRWRGHFVRIGGTADLDDELRAWFQESYDTVGLPSEFAAPAGPPAGDGRG